MGCFGRHLLVFLLLAPALLAAGAKFSDCFPPAALSRFWLEPSYLSSNPNIQRFLTADFYSYAFDNSTQSLGLQDVTLATRQQLLASLPAESQREFSVAAAELGAASESLSSATNASGAAHSLSQKAQKSSAELVTAAQLALYYSPLPLASLAILPTLLRSQDFVYYAVLYPRAYSAALSGSADAFEHASNSAAEVARMADGRMSSLSSAGAGSAQYSGRAKQAYFEAQSFLASCRGGSHLSGVADYFSSRPALPDFSQADFSGSLSGIAGNGENSSLMRMASLYSSLLQAWKDMEGEYAAAHSSAQQEARGLSDELSALEGEKLRLIGESQQESAGIIFVGPDFSGLYAGLQNAREKLAEARQQVALAEAASSQENSADFLARAIAHSRTAAEAASTARSSLSSVRKNADDAVERQKGLASFAIGRAEARLSDNVSSYPEAQAKQASSDLLQKAKSSFASASYSRALGERFSGYSAALEQASASLAVLEGRARYQASGQAGRALYSLSALLERAQKDGLDVGYEKEKLSDYESLLSAAVSPDISSAITDAAEQDRLAVLLRLAEAYSSLSEEYAAVKQVVDEIRTYEPGFLPSFDSLAAAFPDGKLDTGGSTGSLAAMQGRLLEFSQEASFRLPAHLSKVLSQNARIHELSDLPALGKAGRYRASVTVSNPAQLGYSGQLQVAVQTSVPLYKSDQVSGDPLADAYFEKGKTILILSGIGPGESRSFSFERPDSAAQTTSSEDSCSVADAHSADAVRRISFFASRALPSLLLQESLPDGAQSAEARYAGRSIQLSLSGQTATGSLQNVAEGKNSLEIRYEIAEPFSLSLQQAGSEVSGPAGQRMSYTATVSSPAADCDLAQAGFEEPFSGVSDFSVSPLSGQKTSNAAAIQSDIGSTRFSFSFSPLQKGREAQFALSFEVHNASAALALALSSAELSASYLNDSARAAVLSEAKSLASAGRADEALSLLSSSLGAQWGQPASSLDYFRFLQANSSASLLAMQATDAAWQLSESNSTLAAAALSRPLLALRQALSEAGSQFLAGDYKKAAALAARAESGFRSDLSALAWKSAADASDEYAKARKTAPALEEAALLEAESLLSRSHSEYSQGSHLQSYLSSSLALQALSSLARESEQNSIYLLQQFSANYSLLRADAEQKLSKYSSEYSALSSQGKSRLPATPSQLSSRIGETDRAMASAAKGKPTASEALAAANQSYQKLSSIVSSMGESLSGLESSAQASLDVARLAASEARQKAEAAPELSQIDSEVSRAGEMLSNSLFAESLASSGRAIKAANALLGSKAAPGLDAKTLALGAVSLAFLAAAAFYFWGSRRKRESKKEKKGIPRAQA